jgi:tRNA-dihydrouridine synthase 3
MENTVTVEIPNIEYNCRQADAGAVHNADAYADDIKVAMKSGSGEGVPAAVATNSDSNTPNVSETITQSKDPVSVLQPSNDRPNNHHTDQYELKVRKEYIVNERPKCLDPLPGTTQTQTQPQTQPAAQKQDKNKNMKGMNKKRPRDKRAPDSEKLCLFVVRGESCPHGTTCKFSHDVDEYIRTKPQDLTNIQGGCPSFRIQGFCRYGICCRLASTHTTKAGTNISTSNNSTDTDSNDGNAEIKTTFNILDRQVLTQLRKNQFPFVCPRNPFQGKQMPEAARKIFSAPLPKDDVDDGPRLPNKTIDFSGKVYIAPLTTVGNLPFRRIMKHFGADITCGEMAVATCLLEGKHTEWSLVKRHVSEDVFGVQLAAGHPDQFVRAAEILKKHVRMDFVDLNLGCPLDILCNKGAGAHMMLREKRLKDSLIGICNTLDVPVTIKMRTGWDGAKPIAHKLVPHIQSWGVDGLSAIFVHGRSRLQRYSKDADWDYISQVAKSQSDEYRKIPIIGNGDIFSYTDYEDKIAREGVQATAMLARGALIKPWLSTEIKERRHWDISATERMDILKDFVRFGLEHWGSDQQGVNTTRRFLLEWLSFLCRYVPVALLERIPQAMNQRPPTHMVGRSDLETLFMSTCSYDWLKISEMLLGPVPVDFEFEPKHKASAYPK